MIVKYISKAYNIIPIYFLSLFDADILIRNKLRIAFFHNGLLPSNIFTSNQDFLFQMIGCFVKIKTCNKNTRMLIKNLYNTYTILHTTKEKSRYSASLHKHLQDRDQTIEKEKSKCNPYLCSSQQK